MAGALRRDGDANTVFLKILTHADHQRKDLLKIL